MSDNETGEEQSKQERKVALKMKISALAKEEFEVSVLIQLQHSCLHCFMQFNKW